ncbi:hypothetical protein IPG41_06435 [Candidatus Peregrinibacteria bacterium]|nr:MAG: hypothetical protein IPG41_06435 [Candidatus Peregrinibacteria bacterium]
MRSNRNLYFLPHVLADAFLMLPSFVSDTGWLLGFDQARTLTSHPVLTLYLAYLPASFKVWCLWFLVYALSVFALVLFQKRAERVLPFKDPYFYLSFGLGLLLMPLLSLAIAVVFALFAGTCLVLLELFAWIFSS